MKCAEPQGKGREQFVCNAWLPTSQARIPAVCLDPVRKQDLISKTDVFEATFPCLRSSAAFQGLAQASRETWIRTRGRNNAVKTTKEKYIKKGIAVQTKAVLQLESYNREKADFAQYSNIKFDRTAVWLFMHLNVSTKTKKVWQKLNHFPKNLWTYWQLAPVFEDPFLQNMQPELQLRYTTIGSSLWHSGDQIHKNAGNPFMEVNGILAKHESGPSVELFTSKNLHRKHLKLTRVTTRGWTSHVWFFFVCL